MFRIKDTIEPFRILYGSHKSPPNHPTQGCFLLEIEGLRFLIVASGGLGWEHVSVSTGERCPLWEEMEIIKNQFWEPSDLVVQFMVPKRDHINNHPYCLHMWRKEGTNDFCERPPSVLVGI